MREGGREGGTEGGREGVSEHKGEIFQNFKLLFSKKVSHTESGKYNPHLLPVLIVRAP